MVRAGEDIGVPGDQGFRDLQSSEKLPFEVPSSCSERPILVPGVGWGCDSTFCSQADAPPLKHPPSIPVQEGHGIPTEPQCPLQLLPQQGHTQRGLRQQFGSPLWDLMPLGPLSPWEHHPLGHNMPFLPFPP